MSLIRQELDIHGFAKVSGLIESTEVPDSMYVKRARYAKAIWNNRKKDDRLRLLISTDPTPAHMINFQKLMMQISERLSMSQPALIRSKPGCSQQYYHTDYPPGLVESLAPDDRPYTLIVALSSYGADLQIIDRGGNAITVHINCGDGLVFAGDIVHAGAAYADTNLRFHAYLNSPAYQRPKDVTWPAKHAGGP